MANTMPTRKDLAEAQKKYNNANYDLNQLESDLESARKRLAYEQGIRETTPLGTGGYRNQTRKVNELNARIAELQTKVASQKTTVNSLKSSMESMANTIVKATNAAQNEKKQTGLRDDAKRMGEKNLQAAKNNLQRLRDDTAASPEAIKAAERAVAVAQGQIAGKLNIDGKPWEGAPKPPGEDVPKLADDAIVTDTGPWAKNATWSSLIRFINSGDPKTKIGMTEGGTDIVQNGKRIFLLPDATGKFTFSGDNPSVLTEEAFRAKLYRMSAEEIKSLQKKLNLKPTGLFSDVIEDATKSASAITLENYRNALRVAASPNGKIAENPYSFDIYAKMLKQATGGGGTSGRSVSRQITSFDAGDAEGILNEFYADTLGRRATADEIAKFNALINKRAKARPTTSTTVSSGGVSTTTQTPGFTSEDARMLAEKQARATPGATGFMAATQYMDVINSLIRNPLG